MQAKTQIDGVCELHLPACWEHDSDYAYGDVQATIYDNQHTLGSAPPNEKDGYLIEIRADRIVLFRTKGSEHIVVEERDRSGDVADKILSLIDIAERVRNHPDVRPEALGLSSL